MNARYACLVLALITPLALHAQPSPPVVSAELGGPGFERIAQRMGWQTGTLTPQQMRYISDPRAVKGGALRFAVGEFPATLRAYGKDENSLITRLITSFVYETLISVNPITLEFVPCIASHWKVDADGQTYWFRIDPNARFSDGYPVTAEDVLATYKPAIDSTILSPYTNSFYAEFDPPEAVSPYIFKVRSKERNWKNMFYFGGATILPAHVIGGMSGGEYLEKFEYNMPSGSGPYIIAPVDVENQGSIKLQRRSNWWQEKYSINKGLYNFDTIAMVVVENSDEEQAMLNGGEIDIHVHQNKYLWESGSPKDLLSRGLLQRRRIYNDDPMGMGGFVFNMRRPPFDDPRIREAFICLFDRDAVLGNALSDVELLTSHFPKSEYAYSDTIIDEYDPLRADQLLVEAGYSKRNESGLLVHASTGEPLEIPILAPGDAMRAANIVRDELREHGITAWVDAADPSTTFQRLQEHDFFVGWIIWSGLLFPNPVSSYHSRFADIPNTNNISGFKNKEADSLIDLELLTFDQSKRVTILRQLDSILMTSRQYALAWFAPYDRITYWNKFGHPDFYLGKISDWQSILTLWWIDKKKEQMVEKGRTNASVKMETEPTDVKFWEEWKHKR